MKGNSDLTLNPSGLATRAEVATMLQRFNELFGEGRSSFLIGRKPS